MNTKKITEILGSPGRMVSASKGLYDFDNPDHFTVFNSNVVTKDGVKIWFGDLDLSLEHPKLTQLARELNTTLFVLHEMDGRFENEVNPKLDQAVFSTDGETPAVCPRYAEYYAFNNRKELLRIPEPVPTEAELAERDAKIAATYKESDFKAINLLSDREIKRIRQEEGVDAVEFYNEIDFSMFSVGLDAETSPLHVFWKFLHAKTGLDKEEFNKRSLDYYITKSDDEFLHKQFEYWVRTFHGRYMHEYRIQKEVGMGMALQGPASFGADPDWVQSGKIYLRNQIK